MGVKALRKIQLGDETTAGTAVASDTVWRGMGTIQDGREVVFVEEDVGNLGGSDRTYISKLEAMLTMDETPATFQQAPHVFEAGVKLVTTGAADGAGSGKIYTYTFSTSSGNTIRSYTIEGGDDQQAEEMEYSFVQGFRLSGAGGEPVMIAADWLGRQVTNTTFTASQTAPTVEEVLFSKGKLYIDAEGGTIGSTQVTNTLLEFEVEVDSGYIPKYTADGNLYFSFNRNVGPEITLRVVYEHNASAVTEKTNWRNETARLVRLNFDGSALTTAGTTYTYNTLRIDLAGKYESFEKLGERDGNDILEAVFRGRYNSTANLFAEIVVVNELATIP